LLAVTRRLAAPGGESGMLRSPGLLRKHYSPRARLLVWSWRDEADLERQSVQAGLAMEQVYVVAHRRIPLGGRFGRVSVIPHDAEAFARAIYAELHACDAAGARWVIVETPPETAEWRAVTDRLNRAAAS